MLTLIHFVLAFFVSHADVEALRSTAPAYLELDSAAEHLRAARLAAVVYDVDADLLLSIAYHESRYQHREVTPEAGGKVSCGVMTPEPMRNRRRCSVATSSVLAGYMHGAEHLRGWLDACHQRTHCALLGYAGGFRLIEICRRAEQLRACQTPDVFRQRAALIRVRRSR